jgi:predicted AAA+ superfamily ATPase
MKEFGKRHFKNTAYIMFEKNENMKQLFNGSLKPKDLIPFLEAEANTKIEPENTLIIFDEIQAIPNALTSLKFFREEAPEYKIICAGSTLGVTLHSSDSFPVGQVTFMSLYPLNFAEFLMAMSENSLAELYLNESPKKLQTFHEKFIKLLQLYKFIGGMPEVIEKYITTNNLTDVRAIQNEILESYMNDFSKYLTPINAEKTRDLYSSIPSHLARENKKFKYGLIKKGAKGRDYSFILRWLLDSSLVLKINNLSSVQLPAKIYEDKSKFKLFMHDIGILGALAEVDIRSVIDDSILRKEFRGALAEQFVCQELVASEVNMNYWSSKDSKYEVDFIINEKASLIPVEVKGGHNLNSPSLKKYIEKYSPKKSYKLSMNPYKENLEIDNLPIYLAEKLGVTRKTKKG